MRRIIIGDVHGCIDELEELIYTLNINTYDSIFFIGDLIDRGPDSVAVVKKCYALSIDYEVKLILGNHEEKFLRYLHHIENKTGLENKMSGIDEFPKLLSELNRDEIDFIKNAYYSITLLQTLCSPAPVIPQSPYCRFSSQPIFAFAIRATRREFSFPVV
jgi:predicted MPP superfamily phosphohydrolase